MSEDRKNIEINEQMAVRRKNIGHKNDFLSDWKYAKKHKERKRFLSNIIFSLLSLLAIIILAVAFLVYFVEVN